MHLTVEQALSVYPLSEGKWVAGRSGAYRIVKSVNVMDAPDIADWIKEGELLFTTAYLIKDCPQDAVALLRKLERRGSAGLGIKLGRFWDSMPEALIEEADELGFPLIELPYRFTFSDQVNGLFQAEMQRNTKALHMVLDKQKQLMRIALAADHAQQVFGAVGSVIGYPIAIVGANGRILYNETSYPEALLTEGWPWRNQHRFVNGPAFRCYRVPFALRENGAGFALFFIQDPLSIKAEEGLFHQASEIFSYYLSSAKQAGIHYASHQEFGALIARHLRGGVPAEAVSDYATRYDIPSLKGGYRCVWAEIPSAAERPNPDGELKALRGEWNDNPVIKELSGVHVELEDGLLSIIPSDSLAGRGMRLDSILTASLQSLFGDKGASVPRIGISMPKDRIVSLREAYAECRETVRLAERLGIRERVVSFGEVEWMSLFEDVPKERMVRYCDNLLGPLLSKDPEYAAEMLHTLEVFLENDAQINETAKRLYIHRNTAAYRIEKIGELLDIDFKKIHDLLRLKLVFLFRREMFGTSSEAAHSKGRRKLWTES